MTEGKNKPGATELEAKTTESRPRLTSEAGTDPSVPLAGHRGETVPGRLDPPLPSPEAATARPRVGSRVGQTLAGRYRLEKLLAKGGMGRVYLATQIPLMRPVAIKLLNPEFKQTDPNFAKRFFLEAAICARLTHPNVVVVHDYGESEERDLFMAMEFLDGRSLSYAITREGPMIPGRVLHIGSQICRALREAHAKGVVHRDLKPGNIILIQAGDDADFVKVLDFGLVKLVQPEGGGPPVFGALEGEVEAELTKEGVLLGSPRYMSPEQIRGESLDARTDVYSLGVILFQMAAGRPPFVGATSVDVIYKHLNLPIPKIAEISPEVSCPRPLEVLIHRCLMKHREDRFSSMDELMNALKETSQNITGQPLEGDSFAPKRAPAERSQASQPIRPARTPTPTPTPTKKMEAALSKTRVIEPAVLRAATTGVEAPQEAGALLATRSMVTDSPLAGPNAEVDAVPYEVSVSSNFREATFREPALDPGVTQKSGALAQTTPAKLPLFLAFAGFLISILALVLVIGPRFRPEPSGPSAPHRATGAIGATGASVSSGPTGVANPTLVPPSAILKVTSQPEGAELMLLGRSLGRTPLELAVPKSDQSLTLVLVLEGYEVTELTVVPDRLEVPVEAVLVASRPAETPVSMETLVEAETPEESGPDAPKKKLKPKPAAKKTRPRAPAYYRDNPY